MINLKYNGKVGPETDEQLNSLKDETLQIYNNLKENDSLSGESDSKLRWDNQEISFMLLDGLSEDFIYKLFSKDLTKDLLSLDTLRSLALIMGEGFAEHFIGKEFSPDDIANAITEQVLSENAIPVKTDEAVDAAQQEKIRQLYDEIEAAREKISNNEKVIQTLQSEHKNLIDFLKQEIDLIKGYYEEFKTYNEKNEQEISDINQELMQSKISEAEAKKDSEIGELQEEIKFNKDLYDKEINMKDNEIEDLRKQVDEYKKKLLDDDGNSGKAEVKNRELSMPRGYPDRKFSKRESKKRIEQVMNAFQNRLDYQIEVIADAYERGLPYDDLLRLYQCEDGSKEKMQLLEYVMLKLAASEKY